MVNQILLHRWYIILATLTTIAASQAIFFPRWPTAKPLSQAELNLQIQSVVPKAQQLPGKPPTRSYDLASSAQLIWKFPDGEVLTLMRGTSRELANFQTAFLSRADPALQIKDRVLVSSPLPLASGRLHGRSILQTCILNGSDGTRGLGVTESQLNNPSSRLSSGTMQRVNEFLGLSLTPANSCVLVTLKAAPSQPEPNKLLLKTVIEAITPSFAHGEQSSRRSG